jgi:predicted TIM-barrel fold metal-dependent hydrolase
LPAHISNIIDGDGHVRERDSELVEYLDEPYRSADTILNFPFFPSLDGFQRGAVGARRGVKQRRIDAPAWVDFLDQTGIESTVLYPTAGLSCGLIQDPEWAVTIARGYNSWFYETYHRTNPRLMGVAMLPLQDVEAAVLELRRAVTDLGAVGGMLPANGGEMGIRKPLGDKSFWPLYEEAERLGCALSVHGAPSVGLGINFLSDVPSANILEHPLSQMIQFTSMMRSGMFDQFKTLRMAYLEADTGWVPYIVDRLKGKLPDGATEPTELITSGRIFFSVEADEQSLAYTISRFGDECVIYASDFPHVFKTEQVREELDELLGRDDIPESSLGNILRENAIRLYQLQPDAMPVGLL